MSNAARPLSSRLLILLAVATLYASVSGCNGSAPTKALVASKTPQKSRGDDYLNSALNQLQPERLGITSKAAPVVGLLNQWQGELESDSGEDTLSPDAKGLLEGLLSADQLKLVESPRFSLRDARHIRDNLLFQTTAEFATASARTDLERAVNLFDYVVRNVQLTAETQTSVPLRLYQVLLIGRGSASERAWLFANLLRQIDIDAVILRPRPESQADDGNGEKNDDDSVEADDGRWLVGVLLNDKVYLFDTRLGWPIPSEKDTADTPTVAHPATLAEVLQNGELLRKLDREDQTPYPLAAEDFKSLQVELIGNSSVWAPRMIRLQAALTGDRFVVVSDNLDDSPQGDGLLTRVKKYGRDRWNSDDIVLWPYPEKNLTAFGELDAKQLSRLRVLTYSFDAPIPVEFDPASQQWQEGRPEKTQLKTRIRQLLGDYENAIRSYVQMRLGRIRFPPQARIRPLIRYMDAKAAEDALFWIGASKFEQNVDPVTTLREYLGSYDTCLAFVVHRDNKAEALSIPDLQKVWTRQATNWRSLGGDSRPVHLVGLKGIGPVIQIFVAGILGGNTTLNRRLRDQETTEEVVAAVANDKDAIGMVDLFSIPADQQEVKLLGVHLPGKEVPETFSNGRFAPGYPLAREGSWIASARLILGINLAESGNFAEAIRTLEGIPTNDPQRDGSDLLIRRWKQMASQSTPADKTPASTTGETTTTPTDDSQAPTTGEEEAVSTEKETGDE